MKYFFLFLFFGCFTHPTFAEDEEAPVSTNASLILSSQQVVLNRLVSDKPVLKLDIGITLNKSGFYADILRGSAFDGGASIADETTPTIGWSGQIFKNYDVDVSATYFNLKKLDSSDGDLLESTIMVGRRFDPTDSFGIRPYASLTFVKTISGEAIEGPAQGSVGLKLYYQKKWLEIRPSLEVFYDRGVQAVAYNHVTVSLTRHLDLVGSVNLYLLSVPTVHTTDINVVYSLGISLDY